MKDFWVFNRFIELEMIRDVKNKEGIVLKKEMISFNTDDTFFTVKCQKYLSHMKDEALIEIYNIDKKLYLELKNKDYKYINIYAGYRNNGQLKRFLVMSNQVLLMTYDRSDLNTSKVKILCSSRYRKRDNVTSITFKQGTSIYAALNTLCRRKGLRVYIDPRLKNKILQSELVVTDEGDAINRIIRDYDFISIANDPKDNQYDVRFLVLYNTEKRAIIVSPESGTIIKEWVSLNGDNSIRFTSLPVIDYHIGDSVKFQSKWFNQSLDTSGDYTTWQKNTNVLFKFQEKTNQKDLSLSESQIQTLKTELNVSDAVFNEMYKNNHPVLREAVIKLKRLDSKDHVWDDDRWNEYTIIQLEYNLDVKGEFQVSILGKPSSAFKRKIKRI